MDQQVQASSPDLTPTLHTSGGVVEIDDTKYAVGLMWQPVQNIDDPMVEIRETMESEMDADLYCQRQATVAQYGIGRTKLGHRAGMPSLAGTVASALSDKESFCAVFKVNEGWWFIAVRNNLILAEEDVLFATEEEAQRAYSSMMAVPDWDLCIVPAGWNIENTTQMALSELVMRGRKVRLLEINAARKTTFLLAIAILVVITLGVLIWLFVGLLKTIFPPQQIQSVPKPQVVEVIQPTPEKPKPWEKIVSTKELIQKCWDNFYQVKSVVFPGWRQGVISCTKEGMTTSWTRDAAEGYLSWMKFGINQYQFTDLTVDVGAGGNNATGSIIFNNLPVIASLPSFTPQQLTEDLSEIQQATKLGIQFNQQTLLDPPNRPDGSRPPNQKLYTYFAFSVTSDYTPWEWIKFFEKFSGFELIKIEYNPSNDASTKWKYEGRIYAK